MSDFNETRPQWIQEHVPAEVVNSGIFRVKFILINGTEVDVDIMNNIEIRYELIEQQLAEAPTQFLWWSALYTEAKAMVALVEKRIKTRKAVLTDVALKEAAEAKVKLTEKQVSTIVEQDSVLENLDAQLIVLQKNASKLWYTTQAVIMTAENLRSLSGFKKQERRNEA